jgi:hypothetical protein
MVVDGRAQFVGSDARQARAAIAQAGRAAKVRTCPRNGGRLTSRRQTQTGQIVGGPYPLGGRRGRPAR